MASFDISKLPDLHKSGEDIIREINAELLTKFSSAEVGIIPEDEAQRGMVGVSIEHIFSFFFFLRCSAISNHSLLAPLTLFILLVGHEPDRDCWTHGTNSCTDP